MAKINKKSWDIRKDKPLVSVCTITFNHAPYIRQCLDGILMQETDFPVELIVHDDASMDGTAEIIREYAIKYPEVMVPILQEENQWSLKGLSVSPAYVWPKTRGKYLAICEGDDYWTDPYKLQKQVDFLEAHEECVMCFHNMRVLDWNGTLKPRELPYKENRIFSPEQTLTMHIPTLTRMFRNYVHDYPPDVKSFNGDVFLTAFLSQYGKTAYLNFDGAVYRKHAGGVYSGSSKILNCERSIATNRAILRELPAVNQRGVWKNTNGWIYLKCVELLNNRQYGRFFLSVVDLLISAVRARTIWRVLRLCRYVVRKIWGSVRGASI